MKKIVLGLMLSALVAGMWSCADKNTPATTPAEHTQKDSTGNTQPAVLPIIETLDTVSVSVDKAVLQGRVNLDITDYRDIAFGVLVSSDRKDLDKYIGDMYRGTVLNEDVFTVSVSPLRAETQYFYRAWVFLNNIQYEYGEVKTFTTPEPAPVFASGAFSISTTEQVCFALGNLQYQAGTDTWRFAEHQYDTLGVANSNISTSCSGWIDLFGWGTGNDPAKSDTESSEYATFTDWGTHPILNGNTTDAPNTWRTLTKAEWNHIFYTRPNAATLFGLGSVNGVNGLILLPDNWTTPTGLTFHSAISQGMTDGGDIFSDYGSDHYLDNSYTAAQWQKMESYGAVFLPASGFRYGTTIDFMGTNGFYWSGTDNGWYGAYSLGFSANSISPLGIDKCCVGKSVRLVRTL